MVELLNPEPHPTRARILLVEDEVLIRAFVSEELRDAGFAVVEAAHADEALAFFNAGESVDMVVSDIHMPGSINGMELARQLKARFPFLPILLTSGNIGPHDREGLDLFLPKPYLPMQAIEIILKTLGLQTPSKMS